MYGAAREFTYGELKFDDYDAEEAHTENLSIADHHTIPSERGAVVVFLFVFAIMVLGVIVSVVVLSTVENDSL
jgi:hypothetical protein